MAERNENHLEVALARSARGDTLAFGEIVRAHQAMVYSLALHFLRDASLAEDVAQEVFLELYRNLTRIKSAAHLRFWLRKVTCHRSIDRFRRKRPDGMLSLEEVPEPAAPARADDPLLEERLWRLVGSLPDKQRLALILRYQEDMTVPEIAEVMEIPINTVKSSIERALALLRGIVGSGPVADAENAAVRVVRTLMGPDLSEKVIAPFIHAQLSQPRGGVAIGGLLVEVLRDSALAPLPVAAAA